MDDDLDLFGQAAASPKAVRLGRRVFLPAPVRVQVEAMRRAGASLAAIAEALGVCVSTVSIRLGAELERGLPGGRPAGRPRWSPSAAERDRVRQLAAEGVAAGRIAAALGVSVPTLKRGCAADLARGRRCRADSAEGGAHG